MKSRKTYLKYIKELADRGFIHCEEFKKVEERINNYYNNWGLK